MIPDMLIVVSFSAGCCDEAGISSEENSYPLLSHTHTLVTISQNTQKERNTISFLPLCFALFLFFFFIILALCMMVGLLCCFLLLSLFTLAYSTDLTDASNVLQDHMSALFLFDF